jgi:flagellar biosynthesis protein FliR
MLCEIALALVARLNNALQLSHTSAPLKMLLTLLALTAVLKIVPGLYLTFAGQLFGALRQ